LRAARRAGPRVGARVGEGVSEFVWGTRKVRAATRARSRTREPPTPTATRAPNTLPRPLTLADLRWPGRPVAHVGQPREHGAQAVEQSQQGQDLRLGGEVEYQYALQRGRGLARLAARTAKAAQPVGTLAAGCFRDAKVGAQKRAAELVLFPSRTTARR
jgi:hypothetical protein